MDEFVLSCYGVTVQVTDPTKSGICDLLAASVPPLFHPASPPDTVAVSYALSLDPLAAPTDDPLYAVTRDTVPVLAQATDEEVIRWLGRDIDLIVAERSHQMLFIRAGVVGWRGLALIIPDTGGTGTSTLVAELVRRGATYYSDTFAVLDDAGLIHPYPRLLSLGPDRLCPPDLRLDREMVLAPLPVGLILAGSWHPDSSWQPSVLRGPRAVRPLIDATVVAHQQADRLAQVATTLSQEAVTLQGSWTEAADVAAQVLDLVEEGLMSHAIAPQHDHSLAADLAAVAAARLQPGSSRPAPTPRQLFAARYVRITDFLSPPEHQRMLEQALAHEEEFAESGIIDAQGTTTLDHGFRKSRTLWGPRLEELWPMIEPRLRAVLPAVRQDLGVDWFPLDAFERQLTAHSGGGFFAPHVDTGNPVVANRRISCVYYFHALPRRFNGGELKLYDTWVTPTGSTAAATHTALTPIDNSIVFFPSDAFHEVTPVQPATDAFADSRFAVTIWVREEEQPA